MRDSSALGGRLMRRRVATRTGVRRGEDNDNTVMGRLIFLRALIGAHHRAAGQKGSTTHLRGSARGTSSASEDQQQQCTTRQRTRRKRGCATCCITPP